MNILYLAHRVPFPPDKGDKIRSFNQIKYLSRNNKIHLFAFVDEARELEFKKPLEDYCSDVTLVLLNKYVSMSKYVFSAIINTPLSVVSYNNAKMKRNVDRFLENETIDACLIFSSQMAQYVLRYRNIRKVMDFVDVDSDKWDQYSKFKSFPLSLLYREEANRLKRYENLVASQVGVSIFVTNEDKELFLSRNEGVPCAVVRNGIDTDYFRANAFLTGASLQVDNPGPIIVFVGAMDYFPNVDGMIFFLTEVLPSIRREVPDIRVDIVGRNPAPEILKMARNIPGVHITGTVPDVRPYLRRARIAVAPLRMARGIQNKVLEYMAMGLPVVVSRKAHEGIPAKMGEHLLVADTPQEYHAAITQLIARPELCHKLGENARAFVEENYSWESAIDQLDTILRTACPQDQSRNRDGSI